LKKENSSPTGENRFEGKTRRGVNDIPDVVPGLWRKNPAASARKN